MSNIAALPLGAFPAPTAYVEKEYFPEIGTNPSGLRPVGRAVLVKPYKTHETTKSGIVLPSSVSQKDQLAEHRVVVIEIGENAWCTEPSPRCKVGDRVLIGKWAGYSADGPADNERYRIIQDNDIFTVITKEA